MSFEQHFGSRRFHFKSPNCDTVAMSEKRLAADGTADTYAEVVRWSGAHAVQLWERAAATEHSDYVRDRPRNVTEHSPSKNDSYGPRPNCTQMCEICQRFHQTGVRVCCMQKGHIEEGHLCSWCLSRLEQKFMESEEAKKKPPCMFPKIKAALLEELRADEGPYVHLKDRKNHSRFRSKTKQEDIVCRKCYHLHKIPSFCNCERAVVLESAGSNVTGGNSSVCKPSVMSVSSNTFETVSGASSSGVNDQQSSSSAGPGITRAHAVTADKRQKKRAKIAPCEETCGTLLFEGGDPEDANCTTRCIKAAGHPPPHVFKCPKHCDSANFLQLDSDGEGFVGPVNNGSSNNELENKKQKHSGAIVDSGAFVSCCSKDYAVAIPVQAKNRKLVMKTVEDTKMKHEGRKPQVPYQNERGCQLFVDFQVTNTAKPIIAVRERRARGQLTCFGPKVCKIINDADAISRIEAILQESTGFDMVEEGGQFYLQAELKPELGQVAPVSTGSESAIASGWFCYRANAWFCYRASQQSS